MKGPVSEACLAFIRWGKGGGGKVNYNIWPFYLYIVTSFYLSSLAYCPKIPTWQFGLLIFLVGNKES